VGRKLRLDAGTAADVADAEMAIADLNRDVRALANSEAIARLLLRAEAVASSKIEGLEVGGRRSSPRFCWFPTRPGHLRLAQVRSAGRRAAALNPCSVIGARLPRARSAWYDS
jgi:hypothetical protein